MDAGGTEPGLAVQVREVRPGTADFEQVLALAAQVLGQDRHLVSSIPGAQESRVLGAFYGTRCTGFLRYLIQVIGAETGSPAVVHNGEPLREGYVEAFGVDQRLRRRGIGTALQQHAARQCRIAGCYQICSRSPVTSTENYALKIAAGYVLHPVTKTTLTTSSCACNQPHQVLVEDALWAAFRSGCGSPSSSSQVLSGKRRTRSRY